MTDQIICSIAMIKQNVFMIFSISDLYVIHRFLIKYKHNFKKAPTFKLVFKPVFQRIRKKETLKQ